MRQLPHETRLHLLALAAGLPAVVTALALLWSGGYSLKLEWTLTALVVGVWLGCAAAVRDGIIQPLHTIANLIAAQREGDLSVRGRFERDDDALGGALAEVNRLGDRLRELRMGALEATALLDKVMSEVDVALLVFDHEQRLRLVNKAGERLLTVRPGDRRGPQGQSAAELGLALVLDGEAPRTVSLPAEPKDGSAASPWELRRNVLRIDGRPHQLVVLTDVRRALRDEERQAWQRLVRVLGHEINNSLAPIHSIAGTLKATLARPDRAADWQEDLASGLDVIERRAEALGRFMRSYARVARLPPPRLGPVDVAAWVERVVALEKRLPVALLPPAGPPVTLSGDGDQLDQVLINLVHNAVDAALETGGGVSVAWARRGERLELHVRDEGPGLAATANLFVPFFTTKPNGLGIGLHLSRQIAEAHDGSLHLYNRDERPGCDAVLVLPRAA